MMLTYIPEAKRTQLASLVLMTKHIYATYNVAPNALTGTDWYLIEENL